MMGDWNENEHPRGTDGTWVDKEGRAPSGTNDLPDDGPYGNLFAGAYDPDSLDMMAEEQEKVLDHALETGRPISGLDMERRKQYIDKALKAFGTDSQAMFSTTDDLGRRHYAPQRSAMHERIIQRFLDRAERVPCDGQALFTGGLGGAGKTTVLTKYAGIDPDEWLALNNDDIKEEMARRGMVPSVRGLTPMEACPLVHEEASDILAELRNRALAQHRNVILDGTMNNVASTRRKINQLRDHGYAVNCLFVDITPDTSKQRADMRYQRGMDRYVTQRQGCGGRYLPDRIIEAQRSDDPRFRSRNAATVTQLADEGAFDRQPLIYDNNGSAPRRITFTQFASGRVGD